jgi:hypothetical protein
MENRFPISLDVENMYHSIPRDEALTHLKSVLANAQIDRCSIPVDDIVNLVATCINSNHFKHSGHTYYQKQGLPMGNRLSGILAELFMDKVVKETYEKLNLQRPNFRYVDDLLVFTKDEEDAQRIFAAFNDNPYGIKFTIEIPNNQEIAYLDFKVKINENGIASFDFYRKTTRKENFVNAQTALPNQAIRSIINSEWNRIRKRCSDIQNWEHHGKDFQNRLRINGHPKEALKMISHDELVSQNPLREKQTQKFFLSIPYVNNEVQYKIRNALKGLGVKIHIAHKGEKLKNSFKYREKTKCDMKNCKMKSHICMTKGAVYEIKCDICSKSYIGSSWRYLHTRFKEHLNQRASPIYSHNQKCKGNLTVKVLAIDGNIQRMRIKEAMLIKERKPALNGKEDLFKAHILFH